MDGQTDGIAVASTALAMRALLHAVKNVVECGVVCIRNMVMTQADRKRSDAMEMWILV